MSNKDPKIYLLNFDVSCHNYSPLYMYNTILAIYIQLVLHFKPQCVHCSIVKSGTGMYCAFNCVETYYFYVLTKSTLCTLVKHWNNLSQDNFTKRIQLQFLPHTIHLYVIKFSLAISIYMFTNISACMCIKIVSSPSIKIQVLCNITSFLPARSSADNIWKWIDYKSINNIFIYTKKPDMIFFLNISTFSNWIIIFQWHISRWLQLRNSQWMRKLCIYVKKFEIT